MQLRLEENPPTARSARTTWTPSERTKILRNGRGGMCVRGCRPRRCDELSINNLRDQQVRDLEQVFVGSSTPCRVHTRDPSMVIAAGKGVAGGISAPVSRGTLGGYPGEGMSL